MSDQFTPAPAVDHAAPLAQLRVEVDQARIAKGSALLEEAALSLGLSVDGLTLLVRAIQTFPPNYFNS